MITLLLDSNIYDILSKDREQCESICRLIAQARIKIVVTRTVAEELAKSAFGKVPELFPYEYVGNTVARADIMCAGDSLGAGEVYDQHLGESVKHSDAFIADAASWHADWLVSQDARMRQRTSEIKMRARPMDYGEFKESLAQLLAKPDA